MQCNKPLSLPTVLGAETSATEDDDHWMLSLQFGELPAFRGVVGKLVVGDDSPWNNVRSHLKSLTVGCASRVASPHSGPQTCRIRNPQREHRHAPESALGRRPDSASSVCRGFVPDGTRR